MRIDPDTILGQIESIIDTSRYWKNAHVTTSEPYAIEIINLIVKYLDENIESIKMQTYDNKPYTYNDIVEARLGAFNQIKEELLKK